MHECEYRHFVGSASVATNTRSASSVSVTSSVNKTLVSWHITPTGSSWMDLVETLVRGVDRKGTAPCHRISN